MLKNLELTISTLCLRTIPREKLKIHPVAVPALAALLDVQPYRRSACTKALALAAGRDFFWIGSLDALSDSNDTIRTPVLPAGAISDEKVSEYAWADFCDPVRIHTGAAAARWVRAARLHMPRVLCEAQFKCHPLTLSAAARHLYISRRTIGRHLRRLDQ